MCEDALVQAMTACLSPEAATVSTKTFWLNVSIAVISRTLTRGESLKPPVYGRLRDGLIAFENSYKNYCCDRVFANDHEATTAAFKLIWKRQGMWKALPDAFIDQWDDLLGFLARNMAGIIEGNAYEFFEEPPADQQDPVNPGVVLIVFREQLGDTFTEAIGQVNEGDVLFCGAMVTATAPTLLPEEALQVLRDDDEPHWGTRSAFTCELVYARHLQQGEIWQKRSEKAIIAAEE